MKNNSKNYNLNLIQSLLFNLLCELVDFFDANGIKYMLCGGTLLGAVRHKGFIPWDDDIDIILYREQYDKLLNLAKINPVLTKNIKISYPGNKDYFYPFIKAYDTRYKIIEPNIVTKYNSFLYIDIFPLGNYPADEDRRKKFIDYNTSLRNLVLSKCVKRETTTSSYVKWLYKRILFFLLGGERVLTKYLDKYGKKQSLKYKNTNIFGNEVWPSSYTDYFPIDSLGGYSKVSFCGRYFLAPKNPDMYLSTFYGDYMKMPPKEKQICHKIDILKVN